MPIVEYLEERYPDPVMIGSSPESRAHTREQERLAETRVLNPTARWVHATNSPLGHPPDEAVAKLGLDSRTAIVLLTHDPKLDDPALEAALAAGVFYIGALGSTRTHAKRVERMQKAGFTKDQIARIHGPIGLDIGAAGPSEIAVAILAEMTAVLRGKA